MMSDKLLPPLLLTYCRQLLTARAHCAADVTSSRIIWRQYRQQQQLQQQYQEK